MRLRPVLALLFLTLAACDDHGTASPTLVPAEGFGTPRQLVYVASSLPLPKHGGATDSTGSVYVFERDGFAPVGYFSVGRSPEDIAASADGRYVWVVNEVSGDATFFDTTTYALTTLRLGVRPNHSFVTPDHTAVWIGNDGSASISIVRFEDLSVSSPITTGAGHHKVAFATDAGGAFVRGYVSNIVDGTITPVAPEGTVSINVPGTGAGPHGLDFASSNGRLYSCTDAGIDVIATRDEPGTATDETHTVVSRISLPARCSYLRVEPNGTHVLATIPTLATLARVRLSDESVEMFPTASDPDQVVVAGDHAYVSSLGSAVVSFVDLTGALPPSSIAVGSPGAVGHRPLTLDGDRVFVPNQFDDSVSVIDVTTRTVVHTIEQIEGPVDVAVAGPLGGTVYPR